jgi:phosphatidylserine/phosphatidylglycerophosphate/cardiolipin synthase-like enzyme
MKLKLLSSAIIAAVLFVGGIVYAQTASTTTLKNTQVDWAFTQAGQHPEKLLIDVIRSAKSTLDIASYSLTYPDIIQSIKDAKKRGVSVRVISDKIQSSGKAQKEALKILGSSGIPIKINTHSGLMHLKVTIADKRIATTGSFNYTKAASTTNDEVLMVVHDETVAKSFAEQFQGMWNDTTGFKSIDAKIGQP